MASPIINNKLDVYTQIQNDINHIYSHLKYKKEFSPAKREVFNRVLNQIKCLIATNHSSQMQTYDDSNILQRIWIYKFLHQRLEEIKKEISVVTGKFLFNHKIGMRIQPALIHQIQELERACIRIGRMPIYYGTALSDLKNRAANKLSTDKDFIDKDTFQLSLTKSPKAELQGVDIESLDGNNELYGWLRWREIIKQMPETTQSEKVLAALDHAIRIAQKTQFTYKLAECSKDGIGYYRAWSGAANRIKPSAAASINSANLSQLSKSDQAVAEAFKRQISADRKNFIPHLTFTIDIAYDIKEIIDGLKADDFCFFSLGLSDHAVVVQILCESPCTESSPGNYTYHVLNTGDGAEYHQNRFINDKLDIAPWTVKKLHRAALSVEFFERLARYMTTPQYTTHDFYSTHRRFLIEQGKGSYEWDHEIFYPAQAYGSCVYASIEANIQSLFPPSIFKKIQVLKFELSVNKQRDVVFKRQEEQINRKGQEAYSRRRNKVCSESAKLKQSQKLLEIAERRFQESVIKESLPDQG